MALTRAVVLENSDDLGIFFDTNRGHHYLYRVGYRNLIDKSAELNKDGIDEHDGILILKENYFCDDGAYMVVRIIIEMLLKLLRTTLRMKARWVEIRLLWRLLGKRQLPCGCYQFSICYQCICIGLKFQMKDTEKMVGYT
ncbi:hypothetical protein POM88_030860 [Heracleum sosnowskyi]|uniref:Uncharacterized protein n=1 Tax=Heracleum sosnowskyi TaxID=360622 RepID=A0AAD8HY87_9APIA|nr:hypothetical protein POM88_030860 [Heracleum sosnowskyi]